MGLFGNNNDANSFDKMKEKVNDLSGKLRTESRQLDRQIRSIEREEQKTIALIKAAAKKNHMDVCKVLAKSLVHSKKQKNRIYSSKAQMNSVIMQMKAQVSQMKIAGSLKTSTEVMKSMSNLIKIPELQRTMNEMSKEMMKAGIIDEMVQDSLDTVLGDDEDIETVADAEVEKIILEITQGKLSQLPDMATASLGGASAAAATADDDIDEPDEPEEEMAKRLEALRT